MTTLRDAVRMSNEDYWDMRVEAARRKPQATLERAMGYISRHERSIGPALGDALQILGKAHNKIMYERQQKAA